RAAILTRKRHIPAKLAHRSARLQATNHVPMRQILVLDADRRVGKDSFVLQHTQRTSRQQESGCPRKVPVWHGVLFLAFLRRLAYLNRSSQGCADHLLRATGPALIKPGVGNENGQIVPGLIPSARRARRTLAHVVPSCLPYFSHVVQNPELRAPASPLIRRLRRSPLLPPRKAKRQLLSCDELTHLFFRHLAQPLEILHLCCQRVVGPVEPE